MNFTIEIALISLLVILMYYQPTELSTFVDSVLGKIISLFLISYIAITYGRNTGLLAAFIFILLLHHEREGLENPPKASPKDGTLAGEQSKAIQNQMSTGAVKNPGMHNAMQRSAFADKLMASKQKKNDKKKQGFRAEKANVKDTTDAKTDKAAAPANCPPCPKCNEEIAATKETIRNIVEEDRKIKINGLLKGQEERGTYGGESKGMVGKPDKI